MVKISVTTDYEPLVDLFIRNDLEFSEEEPVSTDLIKCWKAESEDGRLIGGCALAVRQDEFIIDGIAVEPEFRKDKVASKLLEEAIRETKSRGGKGIFLVARAPGFFRKHGFLTVPKEEAPNFFECLTCPQFGVDCHPEVMHLIF